MGKHHGTIGQDSLGANVIPKSYWDCRFTAAEKIIFGVAIALAMALHLSPVLDSGFAKPLIVILGVLCFMKPVTGFFFMGASTILPTANADAYDLARLMIEAGDTSGGKIDSGAQYAFFAWVIAVLVFYRRLRLNGIEKMWPLLVLIIWLTLTNGISTLYDSELLKAVMFSLMACQLANEARGNYLKCLYGLAFGCLVVIMAYWGNAVGLPVKLSDWGAERGGLARLGGIQADSVMMWPPILVATGILLGIAAGFGSKSYRGDPPKWSVGIAISLFLASIPPLFATMTTSAYLGMGIIVTVFLLGLFVSASSNQAKAGMMSIMVAMVVAIGVGGTILLATDTFGVHTRLESILLHHNNASQDGRNLESRSEVWDASLDTIRNYPLMGVNFNHGKEKIPAEYASRGFFLSHNVFLDYGRSAGIPAMLIFLWFFLAGRGNWS